MPSAVIPVTAVSSGLGVLLNSGILAVVLTKGKQRYHFLFAGVLAICAIWDLCIFLLMIRNNHIREIQLYGYAIAPCGLLPPLMYHFACTYIDQPRRWTTIFLWAIGLFATAGMATGLLGRIEGVYQYPWGNIFRPDERLTLANLVALPAWLVITLSACWLISKRYRQERDPLFRRHLLYVLAALITISVAVVKVVVILGVEQGLYLTFGMLATDISAAIIGIAIIKDRLFDITLFVKKGLIYSSLATVLILVFSVSEHMLTTYIADLVSGHSDVLHIIAVAASVAVFLPVKRRVERSVDEYFANRKLSF